MKYAYIIHKIKDIDNNIYFGESVNIASMSIPRINSFLDFIDRRSIVYYIEEIVKVIEGNREPFQIEISEVYDFGFDWLEVGKEWTVPNGEKGRTEERIETSEFMECLKIMKDELGLSDEVVVDNRCDEVHVTNPIKGLHNLNEIYLVKGVILLSINQLSTDSFGNTDNELRYKYRDSEFTIRKILWNKRFTAQQIADFMEEAYIYGKPTGLGNIWEYTFKNGMKVRWYNIVTNGADAKVVKGIMKSAFPIY